jgi:hypothetical protein
MGSGVVKIWKDEGMRGMARGMHASWAREISYSSCRIGLYDPIRKVLAQGETDSKVVATHVKFIAAFLSGGIGSAACNPCDLIKTRAQMAFPLTSPKATLSNFAIHMLETKTILATRGFVGMYKGWEATSSRAAMLTSGKHPQAYFHAPWRGYRPEGI